MQSSLQSLLGGLSYAVALIIWQPYLFVNLMGGSLVVVSASVGLYLYHTRGMDWGAAASARLNSEQGYQAVPAGPTDRPEAEQPLPATAWSLQSVALFPACLVWFL